MDTKDLSPKTWRRPSVAAYSRSPSELADKLKRPRSTPIDKNWSSKSSPACSEASHMGHGVRRMGPWLDAMWCSLLMIRMSASQLGGVLAVLLRGPHATPGIEFRKGPRGRWTRVQGL